MVSRYGQVLGEGQKQHMLAWGLEEFYIYLYNLALNKPRKHALIDISLFL